MKRTPLKKKSKSKISTLKRKLWLHFANYIKKRDKYRCFTCGRLAEGSGLHCGHFIPKSVGGLLLYFHEENCRAQCYNCNINLGGNQYIFGQKLGEAKVNQLSALKGKVLKVDENWYLERIKEYEAKLKTVDKND